MSSNTNSYQEIPVAGIDKVKIFQAFYNSVQPINMGWNHPNADLQKIDLAEARKLYDTWGDIDRYGPNSVKFDYVNGRPVKLYIRNNMLVPHSFNNLFKYDKAREIIDDLRAQHD